MVRPRALRQLRSHHRTVAWFTEMTLHHQHF
jgi:hypothetical protein